MTLQELTNHEAGIVVYPDGDTIVCNWSTSCPGENELPRVIMDGSFLIGLSDGLEIIVIESREVKDWRDEVNELAKNGMTVLYDINGDLINPEGGPAHIYVLEDYTYIISPDDWN